MFVPIYKLIYMYSCRFNYNDSYLRLLGELSKIVNPTSEGKLSTIEGQSRTVH